MKGSLPPGETAPNSRFATAAPPCVPGYQTSRIAGTCSAAQRRSSGRPLTTSSTTGVPVADDGLQQLELAPRQLQRRARRRLADHVLPLAGHHHRDVGAAGEVDRPSQLGLVVEPLRVLRRVAAEHVEHRREDPLRRAHAGRVVDPRRPARVAPDALQHRHRLVEVVSRSTTAPACPASSRPAGRSRRSIRGRRGRAAGGRPRCGAAPPTAPPRCGPPRGARGRRGRRGRGPRRRTARRTGPCGASPPARAARSRRAPPPRRRPAPPPRAGGRRRGRRSPSPGRRRRSGRGPRRRSGRARSRASRGCAPRWRRSRRSPRTPGRRAARR